MKYKIINISLFLFFATFFIFNFKYYLSEKNIIHTNKNRANNLQLSNLNNNLPILKSDTNNIIIYRSELDEFNKKRKRRVWEKLLSEDD